MYKLSPAVATQVAESLTSNLRGIASDSGWPTEAVESLSVIYRDGEVIVDVEDSKRDLVNQLEYGTEDMGPNSVTRKFKAAMPDIITPFILEDMSASLEENVSKL